VIVFARSKKMGILTTGILGKVVAYDLPIAQIVILVDQAFVKRFKLVGLIKLPQK